MAGLPPMLGFYVAAAKWATHRCRCRRLEKASLLIVQFSAMPAHKKPDEPRQYSVGDHIKVDLYHGRIVDATVKGLLIEADGDTRYRVEFGRDRTTCGKL